MPGTVTCHRETWQLHTATSETMPLPGTFTHSRSETMPGAVIDSHSEIMPGTVTYSLSETIPGTDTVHTATVRPCQYSNIQPQ